MPHEFDPDAYGDCLHCPLPQQNRIHGERPTPDRPKRFVGHQHPATSKVMEQRSWPRQGSLKRQVLAVIQRNGGATDDEIEDALGRSHQSVSAMRNALMNDGWIEDSEQRRKTRYGNDAIVWRWIP